MDGDENRVGLVGRQRRAEEDYQDEDRGDGEGDGQDKGEEGGLDSRSVIAIFRDILRVCVQPP